MFDVDYVQIRDSLIDYLNSQNTTTAVYDLSLGLDRRINSVVKYDAYEEPTMQCEYPRVFIRLANKTEKLECFNDNSYSRTLDISFKAYCIYDSIKRTKENEIDMLRNTEAVLRNNPGISADYSDIDDIIMNVSGNASNEIIGSPSKYNKSGVIDFNVLLTTDRSGIIT